MGKQYSFLSKAYLVDVDEVSVRVSILMSDTTFKIEDLECVLYVKPGLISNGFIQIDDMRITVRKWEHRRAKKLMAHLESLGLSVFCKTWRTLGYKYSEQ